MLMVFYLALSSTLFCTVALLSAPALLKQSPEVQRLLEVSSSNSTRKRQVFGEERLRGTMLSAAHALRVKLGLSENAKLTERLAMAGMRGADAGDYFFAAQFLSPLVLAFAASFAPSNTVFCVFAGLVIGYMAPDFWLTRRQGKRKETIRKSMPDAMDLLVICVDAGLGLDQALLRVNDELAISHPEINQEFSQVNLAQRAGQPRLDAWQGLAERTKIEEFAAFVSMLVQTDRFGTPVTKALSRFSEELRQKRRQRAEEKASQTKIKIIFPLVLCIFPCIFIVLLAPAVISIIAGMKGMNGN